MPDKEEFTVRDKRFSASEEQASEKPEKDAGGPAEAAEHQAAKDAFEAEDGKPDTQLPMVNFATFIFSLNSSALVHLGMIEDPGANQKIQNLPLAKQTIDILAMLDEKTRGNLMDDEERMLKNILYDLRILYVKQKG